MFNQPCCEGQRIDDSNNVSNGESYELYSPSFETICKNENDKQSMHCMNLSAPIKPSFILDCKLIFVAKPTILTNHPTIKFKRKFS